MIMQFVLRNAIKNVSDIGEDPSEVKSLNFSSKDTRILESGFRCRHKCGSNDVWIWGLLSHPNTAYYDFITGW